MRVRVNFHNARPFQDRTDLPQVESIKIADIQKADQPLVRKLLISMGDDHEAANANRWLASYFFKRATSIGVRSRRGGRG